MHKNLPPAQDKVYDIFTEVAAFVKWVDATALNMGGLQACKFCRTNRGPSGPTVHFFKLGSWAPGLFGISGDIFVIFYYV